MSTANMNANHVSWKKAAVILVGVFLGLSAAFIGIGYAFVWDKPIHQSQDDFQLEVATKNVEKFPNNASLRVELGWVYIQRHRYDDAIKELENALKLDKDSIPAKINLAIAKAEKGDLQESKKILEEIKGKSPAIEDVRYLLGEIYKEEKAYDQALTEFQFVLNANPGTVDYIYQIANVYELQGKKEKAIEEYQKAIAYIPDYAPAKQALARLKAAEGGGSK